MTPRETLDDMFESVARTQSAEADADDADPARQAAIAEKRAAEIQRQIKAGLRDENGEWIEDEDDADDGEEE